MKNLLRDILYIGMVSGTILVASKWELGSTFENSTQRIIKGITNNGATQTDPGTTRVWHP